MAEAPQHSLLDALEPAAQAHILERVQIIRNWLESRVTDRSDWGDDRLPAPEHIQAVLARLTDDPNGQQHLRALADDLGLSSLATQITLHRCHQQGCFDRPKPRAAHADQYHPHDTQPVQPDIQALRAGVGALLRRIPDKHGRINALVQEGYCRNRGNAQAVATLIERSERNSDDAQLKEGQGHLAHQIDRATAAQAIRAVFRQVSETAQRVQALRHAGVCATEAHAQALVRRFEERDARSNRYNGVLDRCLQRGLFKKIPARPEMDAISQRLAAIFAAVPDQDDRVRLLYRVGICPDEQRARQVVAAHTACATPTDSTVIEQCVRAGLVDRSSPLDRTRQPEPSQPYAIRMPVHEVETISAAVLRSDTAPETQVQALQAIACCRDEAAARRVVADLDQRTPTSAVNRLAATLARKVLTSYQRYHLVGLLVLSAYAPVEVLLFVQRAVPSITTMSDDPAATLALLQRDLVAVYRAFQQVDSTLWRRDLLDAPIVSENRTYGQRCISADQRAAMIAALQTSHAYSEDEAITLFDVLVERGGFGVIDWRCGIPVERAGHAWEEQRVRHILEHHLGALPPQVLQRIETDVQHLKAAMQASGVTTSLTQLLNSQPSSSFRRRLNRRLPVGYGQVQFFRRTENRHQRRQHAYRTRISDQHPSPTADPLAVASTLVTQFAAHTGLTEREAANRLSQVRTYGGIGFIPKDQWLTLVDSRLLALLKFYKLVRIEGRFYTQQALQPVNHYARQLGLRPLSVQLAKALNGAMHKPGRWNSGESERIAAVRKNAGVVLPGTPWLHRVWRLFHIPLNLPIAASSFSEASETSHLLLVVDLGSQLPPGLWVSAHPPGIKEVGLALFQSIWHPGALDWPLRGAPEVLQVPASLLTDEQHDLLDHAAEWLQMRVQVVPDAAQALSLQKVPTTQACLDNLVLVGLPEIQRRNAGQLLTVKDVQDAVLGWIRMSKQGFAHHTPGLDDPTSVMYGLTTPAFQTPAAGFLLPVSGEAQTVQHGVLVDDRFYASAGCSFVAGQILPYRIFPYRYPGRTPDEGMPDAIYVEEQHSVLHYLLRHPRIPGENSHGINR